MSPQPPASNEAILHSMPHSDISPTSPSIIPHLTTTTAPPTTIHPYLYTHHITVLHPSHLPRTSINDMIPHSDPNPNSHSVLPDPHPYNIKTQTPNPCSTLTHPAATHTPIPETTPQPPSPSFQPTNLPPFTHT